MAKDKNEIKKPADSEEKAADSPKGKKNQEAKEAKGKKDTAKVKKAATKKKAAAKAAANEPGLYQKSRQFFKEVRIELKKVTWPSRKETLVSTSVVIVLVFLIAAYLGVVDIALSRALKLLLH